MKRYIKCALDRIEVPSSREAIDILQDYIDQGTYGNQCELDAPPPGVIRTATLYIQGNDANGYILVNGRYLRFYITSNTTKGPNIDTLVRNCRRIQHTFEIMEDIVNFYRSRV